ncbi:hypothetical protein E2K93_05785 [Thalassotalea sp. HSM 43]|uniref:hypothetical protein n=1 Tax=Thalassotalea sp. HSM 43 TaxID=2552945 RepID=UPI001081CC5B|nr:hypothetical protein [Thalassotalea sp. HSM 43]QBY03921.1 hypothetical protein E2K93_05785 [Thalassotalea sp. HSM 43]
MNNLFLVVGVICFLFSWRWSVLLIERCIIELSTSAPDKIKGGAKVFLRSLADLNAPSRENKLFQLGKKPKQLSGKAITSVKKIKKNIVKGHFHSIRNRTNTDQHKLLKALYSAELPFSQKLAYYCCFFSSTIIGIGVTLLGIGVLLTINGTYTEFALYLSMLGFLVFLGFYIAPLSVLLLVVFAWIMPYIMIPMSWLVRVLKLPTKKIMLITGLFSVTYSFYA